MKILHSAEEFPAAQQSIVTLGTFDGVHQGHAFVLRQMSELAARRGLVSVIVSFWPHPRRVLQPESPELPMLNALDERCRLLDSYAIDYLILLPFTAEMSRMSYADFLRDILIGKLNMKIMVMGYDHHFGKNREGNFENVSAYAPILDFEVIELPATRSGEVNISSTKIRNAIAAGDMETANRYLNYRYCLTGTVVKGEGRGKGLGFPTANIQLDNPEKIWPAEGVYAVEVFLGDRHLHGAASIGYNPTFEGQHKTLEVFIFDLDEDLYGQKLTVCFLAFIRAQTKFADAQSLIRQMEADVSLARSILKDP